MSNRAQQVEFLISGMSSAVDGTVTFYAAGTSNLKTIWLDRAKTTPASNPYTLDANGAALLYADGVYKVVVKDAAGATVYTRDNLGFALQDGPWIDVAEYASLTAAVTAIGSTVTDVLIDSTTTLTANTTIPSTMRLNITKKGAINQGTYTLTVNGPFEASRHQVFTGTGAVSFGANAIKTLYGQWFDASIDHTTTVQSVISNLATDQTARLEGSFRVTSLVVNAKNSWHVIVGGKITSIAADTAAGTGVDDRSTSAGALPVFKITNSDHWSIKGSAIDNANREAFWVDTCTDFVIACDVLGSGVNDNLEGARIRYSSNFTIQDMALDHVTNKPASGYRTHANAIVIWDCDHFTVSKVRSRYNGMNGLYVGSGCADFTLDGNLIEHNAGSGIQLAYSSSNPAGTPHGDAAAYFPLRWNIVNNVIRFNRADGMDINNTYSSDIDVYATISGNVMENNGWDNEAASGGAATADGSGIGTFIKINFFTVTGNIAVEPARSGIYLDTCKNWTVSGNHVKKTRSGTAGYGSYVSTCTAGHFAGNDIKITSSLTALTTTSSSQVIFDGNRFDGIMAFSAGTYTGCKFINNRCTAYNQVEAYFDFLDNTITNSNATQNGIQLTASNINIERNVVTATNYGIVSTSMNNNRIVGNNVTGSVGAIRIDGNSSTQVVGNNVTAGTSASVEFLNVCDNCVLASNRANSSSGNSFKTGASCTNTHKYGNIAVTGPTSYAGTFGINY